MVVPSELIHVIHARSLRAYLLENARRITIIDPEEIWFSDTLQGAVLLLAEKKSTPGDRGEGVGIYPVRGREFINTSPSTVFNAPKPISMSTVGKQMDECASRDSYAEMSLTK